MLDIMMQKQKELQERLGTDFEALTDKERAQLMRDHYVYLDSELQEALYEMPYFKSWKNYEDMTTDEQRVAWGKVKAELVDAAHFFMNMLLYAGMTAEELYNMYLSKNEENHRRQDVGYTYKTSYKTQGVVGTGCTVYHEGIAETSHDYVAVLHEDDGNASVYYNTDALSMGIAAVMLKKRFEEMFEECSDSDKALIKETLVSMGVSYE